MRRLALLPLLAVPFVAAPSAGAATFKATILKAPDASSSLLVTVKVPAGWKAKAEKTSVAFSGSRPTLGLAPLLNGKRIVRGFEANLAEAKLSAGARKACGKRLTAKGRSGRGWSANVLSCGRLTMLAFVATSSPVDLGGTELRLGATAKPSAASSAALNAILKGLRIDFRTATARRAPSAQFVTLYTAVASGPLPPRVREIGTVTEGADQTAVDGSYDTAGDVYFAFTTPAGAAERLNQLLIGDTFWSASLTAACYDRFTGYDVVPTSSDALRTDLGSFALPQPLDTQADLTRQLTQSYDVAPVATALDGTSTLQWTSYGLGAAALVSTTTLRPDGFPSHADVRLAPYFANEASLGAVLDFTTPDSLPSVPSPPSPICP